MEVHSKGMDALPGHEMVEGRNLREFIKIRKNSIRCRPPSSWPTLSPAWVTPSPRGIRHRDLKMSNVIVSSTGTAMLLDLVAGADNKNDTDDAMQNPRHHSSTPARVGPLASGKTIPAAELGCIFLYHMLTGQPAARRKSRQDSMPQPHTVHRRRAHPAGTACSTSQATSASGIGGWSSKPDTPPSPAEMLAELKGAINKLNNPDDAGGDDEKARRLPRPRRRMHADVRRVECLARTSSASGSRATAIAYWLRPIPSGVARFNGETKAADCVIFSTGELGESALAAFNRFAEGEATRNPSRAAPGRNQLDWKSQAKPPTIGRCWPCPSSSARCAKGELVPLDAATKTA